LGRCEIVKVMGRYKRVVEKGKLLRRSKDNGLRRVSEGLGCGVKFLESDNRVRCAVISNGYRGGFRG
jgi:hypothetical protein